VGEEKEEILFLPARGRAARQTDVRHIEFRKARKCEIRKIHQRPDGRNQTGIEIASMVPF